MQRAHREGCERTHESITRTLARVFLSTDAVSDFVSVEVLESLADLAQHDSGVVLGVGTLEEWSERGEQKMAHTQE